MKIEGSLNASKLKVAIVCARFNEFITSKLLGGAVDCLTRHDINPSNIDEVWVPGAFEIPLAALALAESKKYDAVICLGAVIRGSTSHYDYVCSETAKGVFENLRGHCVISKIDRKTKMKIRFCRIHTLVLKLVSANFIK